VKWRRQTGGDGAEQMAMIVLVAAAFAVFPNLSANRILIAVAFIAAQGALSYLTAGIAKLISSKWRSGFAIRDILSTYTHGHPLAFSWLQKYPTLSFIGCWSVILFECLFPIMIFGPEWLLIATLVIGLSFHIGCAVFMGLNSFLWSFPGVYPCIVAVVFLLKVPM
jgi:hypothetical protein